MDMSGADAPKGIAMRTLLSIVISSMILVGVAHAQPTVDHAKLVTRSAGIVEGNVVLRAADGYVVQLADGTTQTVPYGDVLELQLDNAAPAPQPVLQPAEPAPVAPQAPRIVVVQEQPQAPAPRVRRHGARYDFSTGIGTLVASYNARSPTTYYNASGSLTFATTAFDFGFDVGRAVTLDFGLAIAQDVSDSACMTEAIHTGVMFGTGRVYAGPELGAMYINEHCDFMGTLGSTTEAGSVDLGAANDFQTLRLGGRAGLRFPLGAKAYLAAEARGGVSLLAINKGMLDVYPQQGASDHAYVDSVTLFDARVMISVGFTP
jgi:hypothetical protein